MHIYKVIVALILVCIGLSAFATYKISQDKCFVNDNVVGQFIVGRTSKYCYIRGQEPKHLQIWADFDTIEQCEEYLSLYN